MSTILDTRTRSIPSLDQAISAACHRIAPTWPLDRFIAVNPHWGFVREHFETAAAQVAEFSGATFLMPRTWMREQWEKGEVTEQDLWSAIRAAGSTLDPEQVLTRLAEQRSESDPLPLATDLADAARGASEPQAFADLVVHQISQHAASYFDTTQSVWQMNRDLGLYGSWKTRLVVDRTIPHRKNRPEFDAFVERLPSEPYEALEFVLAELQIPGDSWAAYLTALLSSVRGWGAWCAYERWQAELEQSTDDRIIELLAIRAAWDWLIVRDHALDWRLKGWHERLVAADSRIDKHAKDHAPDWLFLRAMEAAYQRHLIDGLSQTAGEDMTSVPDVQAVFCIDVRSERYRRALEVASSGRVATRGFAGFFGLPIAHRPFGSADERPQLPGLLPPARSVTEAPADEKDAKELAARRGHRLGMLQRANKFRSGSSSTFTFVETLGLGYGWELLRKGLGFQSPERPDHAGLTSCERHALRPSFDGAAGASELAERADLVAGVLGAMGLRSGFARIVALVGHGSSSTNNPHAAGLDCGACGGQTGEANARLLASLLNDKAVREALVERGIEIPDATVFVGALHDTTTDHVHCHDTDDLPASYAAELDALRGWFDEAGRGCRAERAPTLGLEKLVNRPARLEKAIVKRSRDWAQTRPEWGLADNAAFVVAPRARTKHLDLGGRSFLHDYDWRTDEDFATLTLILTAPMVVTHWINSQYYASTVDNLHFGSGNKLLHNVVGGRLGVFEGNGGDLRIGLSMQSLHDGEEWRHTPLRLSVFVEAPQEAIDRVIDEHDIVRDLVENEWLYLFQIDDDASVSRRETSGRWS